MIANDVERDGFALVPQLLTSTEVAELLAAFEPVQGTETSAGLRHLFRTMPTVASLVHQPKIRQVVTSLLGTEAKAVRAIFFDKTPDANWLVPWHQDRTIAVRERQESAGYGPWSVKEGVIHVQPPVIVLERMVALRLHLDPCGADSGPLRVLPGTHCLGKLTPEQIAAERETRHEVVCTAEVGDALLMRPLLLHASRAVTGTATHRRILHIEWAAVDLPAGLTWYDAI